MIVSQGGKAEFICVIDCKEAHNAVGVRPQDREYLGIITHLGTFRSLVGQFGVKPMAKTFIKAMSLSIGWLREHDVYFYADDIVIFADSFERCLWLLEKTLESLLRDGFVISASKCKLFK